MDFAELIDGCVAYLNAQKFFSDADAETPKPITVIAEHDPEIEDKINRVLAASDGAYVMLTIQRGTNGAKDAPKPVFDDLRIIAHVVEQQTLNRPNGTNQPGSHILNAVIWYLHQPPPEVHPLRHTIVFESFELGQDNNGVAWDATFSTTGGLDPSNQPVRS